MKKQALLVLGLILLAGMTTVYAQSSAAARFEVPFEFVVNNLTLPAGEYVVDYSAKAGVLTIRNMEGHPTAIVLSRPVAGSSPAAKCVLIFNRYGEKSFLSKLWIASETMGRAVPKSTYEREVIALGLSTKPVQVAAKAK